jgi:hypothetical protein
MLDAEQHPVEWTLLLDELREAHEHLGTLVTELGRSGPICDSDFAVHLGHVYAHLNRAWHARNQTAQITDKQWDPFSQFPTDVPPVG